MKKYLCVVCSILLLLICFQYLYFFNGDYFLPKKEIQNNTSMSKDNLLYIDRGDGFEPFQIKGVNIGLGKPGHFATDLSITREEYLRWFQQIQELGANVIRNYTISHPTFYEAFYEYNVDNPNPLYLIHGVWVDDYLINSRLSALDEEFSQPFLDECKNMIDVVHGRFKSARSQSILPDSYRKDISKWVYGYILGIEWESDIVSFTNKCKPQQEQYSGKYLYTENASNFEIFLAKTGDEVIRYECEKYGKQSAVAFSNWPSTCPLEFKEEIKLANKKFGKIDVENIKPTSEFQSALFASYHIYPYYPEYVKYEGEYENTYYEYLRRLNEHHQIPVVISEFGVPSSRGIASYEENRELARDQGHLNETQQGEAIVSLYQDMINAGGAGGIVFIWQDEWFKRTWNTIPTVDLEKNIYWRDLQTNEQHFGLLCFEPGENEKVCYIDGDTSEWGEEDLFFEDGKFRLSLKRDIESLYLLVEANDLNFESDVIYIPFDVTPKTGSKSAKNFNISFSDPCDFVLRIDGKDNSRIFVQERYNTLTALYGNQLVRMYNPFEHVPEKDSPKFDTIHMLLHELDYYHDGVKIDFDRYEFNNEKHYYTLGQTMETGNLYYGNGNPNSKDFDSLTDFSSKGNFIEIRIPWQILNFADLADMRIHDDYYEKYGVEFIRIDEIGIGIGDGESEIKIQEFPMEKFGKNVKYHERLKQSYYILQSFWTDAN